MADDSKDMMERAASLLETVVDWIETAVAAVLAVIIVAAVGVVIHKTTTLVTAIPAPEGSLPP